VSRRVAAIDIGTNSTRLLVADVEDGRIAREVERLLTITRLGDRVDASRRLSEAAMDRVERCVAGYAGRARAFGAERPLAVATSAIRDAANGGDFLQRLESSSGVQTQILTGEEEARTTLRGVASARDLDEAVVVCDIGGGSTELIAGHGADVTFAVSLDMGCVRMSERHLAADPPSPESIASLRAEVSRMLPADFPDGALIGVAGTVTTLATIDLGLDSEIPERIDGHVLARETVERELGRLAALPLDERRQVRGLMPERAPTIVAGAAILAELMLRMAADTLSVSERDILHGAALQAAARRS
jgi:exopolyphosphatase/guanosine-5'-triphosphate,3'-diphosphate pyrophosphatase